MPCRLVIKVSVGGIAIASLAYAKGTTAAGGPPAVPERVPQVPMSLSSQVPLALLNQVSGVLGQGAVLG